MRPSETKGGNGYVLGCSVVVLFVLLAAAGLGYGVYALLELGQRHGIEPGGVILVAVLLVAVYALMQEKRNRR